MACPEVIYFLSLHYLNELCHLHIGEGLKIKKKYNVWLFSHKLSNSKTYMIHGAQTEIQQTNEQKN